MRFEEFHGPVPRAHEMGVFKKAKAFLMRVESGFKHDGSNSGGRLRSRSPTA